MTRFVIEQGYIARSTVASAMAAPVAVRHDWQGKTLVPARYSANLQGIAGHEQSWPLFCDAAISPSDVALG
jgi:hypothetical protein